MRSESTLTERLRKRAVVPPGSSLVLGIGDDCAIYRPRGSAQDLLFTSDQIIEGVHFIKGSHTPAELGRKALVRSLSDIAAMGGGPQFCLVSLCVPGWADSKWVNRFFDGILQLAASTGTVLAGGDLARAERLACDVTVSGAVPRAKALLRGGARPGDEIYVSGALGGSALGLITGKGKAGLRHRRPEPRLALGAFARERLHATAAIDLSDGLSLDLHRLCLASGANAQITAPPSFPGATPEQALHGGEEYELLFTVRQGTKVPQRLAGLSLTRLGFVTIGVNGKVFLDGKILRPMGYDHFRSRQK